MLGIPYHAELCTVIVLVSIQTPLSPFKNSTYVFWTLKFPNYSVCNRFLWSGIHSWRKSKQRIPTPRYWPHFSCWNHPHKFLWATKLLESSWTVDIFLGWKAHNPKHNHNNMEVESFSVPPRRGRVLYKFGVIFHQQKHVFLGEEGCKLTINVRYVTVYVHLPQNEPKYLNHLKIDVVLFVEDHPFGKVLAYLAIDFKINHSCREIYIYIYILPETNNLPPEKIASQKDPGSSSNHQFSGVLASLAVSFREGNWYHFPCILLLMAFQSEWPVEVGSFSHYLQGFIHPRWLAGFLPSTVCMLEGLMSSSVVVVLFLSNTSDADGILGFGEMRNLKRFISP